MFNFPLEPISLSQEGIISPLWEALRLNNKLQFAEYSFANIFFSRRIHNYAFIPSDPPFVFGNSINGDPYLIPTISPLELSETIINYLKDQSLPLFPITDEWLDKLPHTKACMSRANSDYLFTKEKLSTLKGRELSSRRNLIHQLEKHHHLEVKMLTSKEILDALKVLEIWQQEAKQSPEQNDYFACKDALQYMEKLQLFGRILYVDGEPKGFTIGELLTPNTAYVHYAKSDHHLKGVAVYLFQDFARFVSDEVEWINLAQDLDLPSLRQAKKAYHPDKLLSKWRVLL